MPQICVIIIPFVKNFVNQVVLRLAWHAEICHSEAKDITF
jgi:hypothetical protein